MSPARRDVRVAVAQGGLVSPELFSLYSNDVPAPSRHVELALLEDDAASVVTSNSPSLLVGYPEAYVGRLELWLRARRIAINVS